MRLGLGLEWLVAYAVYMGALIAFCAAVIRPKFGIFYLAPLLPLQTIRYKALGVLPLAQYMVDFVLLGVAIGLILNGRSLFPKAPISRVIIAFMIFTFFSLWWGSLAGGFPLPISFAEPRMDFWKNYMVMPILFFFTLSAIDDRRDMEIILALMCLGALALSKNFNNNAISGRDYSNFSYALRTGAAMGYAGVNGLAAFMVQFGVFAATMGIFEKRFFRKIALYIVAGACLYAVVYALSRGAYAAVLVCWVYVGVMRKKPILLILLALFLMFWQELVPGAVRQRVLMTVSESGEVDTSSAGRLTLWEDAMEVIRGNPVIGTGIATYQFLNRSERFTDTHNLFIKIAIEMGVIGLVFFLFILGKAYRMGVRLRKLAQDPFLQSFGLGFSLFMIAVVIVNFFGDRWHYLQVSAYTWMLLAMVARGIKMSEDDQAAGLLPAAAGLPPMPAELRPAFVGPAKLAPPAPGSRRRPIASRMRTPANQR